MSGFEEQAEEKKNTRSLHVVIVVLAFIVGLILINSTFFIYLKWGSKPVVTDYQGSTYITTDRDAYTPKEIVRIIAHNFCKNHPVQGQVTLQIVDGITMGEVTQDINLPVGCYKEIQLPNVGLPVPCEAHDGSYYMVLKSLYPPLGLKSEEGYEFVSNPFTVTIKQGNAC